MWTPKPAIALSSQRAVRRHNLSVVLRHVVERGPRSRATIAADAGLNKSTVSSLVSELMDFGLLVERGAEHRGTAGRPGLVVDVARDGVVALGLEVNVDYVGVQATDLAGGSRYKGMEAADNRDRAVEDVFDRLGGLARSALKAVRAQGLRPIGATVALPGLVDIERGSLLVAPNLHWRDVAVVEMLHQRIGDSSLPIGVDNEANLAALAELWEGAATGVSDFMYCSGEIGVGGGLVLGGELFRGYRGFGGEFGHTTVEPDGLPCACGSRGCLETRAGLEPLLAAAGFNGTAKSPKRGPSSPVAELVRRGQAGDTAALAALADCGRWLGIALGSVVNLLSPQAIVLGGHFAPMTEWLAPVIATELATRVLGGSGAVPPVLTSSLGAEAAMRGAAATQLRRVLADPTLVGAA
jgi:predicted NBD/HSP70 family sugar kinase